MDQQNETASLYQLLDTYRKRLSLRTRQFAIQGPANVTSEVYFDIGDARDNIHRIKERLKHLGTDVPLLADDDPDVTHFFSTLTIPYQIPRPPQIYIERPEQEQEVIKALFTHADQPVTNLYGMSGTGKSLLAIQVARQLTAQNEFQDGVLWGDLDNHSPDDLFSSFLEALGTNVHQNAPSQFAIKRDIVWRLIGHRHLLVVLDNIKDARQITELLPSTAIGLKHCRVLAISINKLASLPFDCNATKLRNFNEIQTLNLFRTYTNHEYVEIYGEHLLEIGKRLEYVPHLLATAARDFATGKASPHAYISILHQNTTQSGIMNNPIREGLELAIRDLSSEQLDIFEHIAVLGDGDWRADMLAAVALRPIAEIKATLDLLVEHELVKYDNNLRYRVNTFIREFARERFNKRPPYHRQAACTLLARCCLDLAQDLDAALMARTDLRDRPGLLADRSSKPFVAAFRERLMPEMSHIRQVLEWAEQSQASEILLRFSSIATMELLKHFAANGYEIRASFMLATLFEPIIWSAGDQHYLRFQSLISSKPWVYTIPTKMGVPTLNDNAADGFDISHAKISDQTGCCELNLEIQVGQIVDGMFAEMCLIDAKWLGVRASGLIFRHSEIIGGHFLACDLSHNVWFECDVRGISLTRCSLRDTLLKNIKLYGAHIEDADFSGAILENVDLRGADLRMVNFTGALLKNVDLRGAKLLDTNFTGATLEHVNIADCRFQGARWAGIHTHDIVVDDRSLLKEIEIQSQEKIKIAVQHRRVRPPQPANLQANIDARAFTITEIKEFASNLRAIDLCSAQLPKVKLRFAKLQKANFRGAVLNDADLSNASLSGADFRAAILQGAILRRADLSDAMLRGAHLDGADLTHATLSDADLRYANLHGVKLNRAILIGADLAHANLSGANLEHANLRGANLLGTNLAGANLAGADLSDANCTKAIFIDAAVTDEQFTKASHVGGAVVASEKIAPLFEGKYDIRSFPRDTYLRHGDYRGDFVKIELAGKDLFGARMPGIFAKCTLISANLACARLEGIFSLVDFTEANMQCARLSGDFVNTIFCAANFLDADLRGASIIGCDLSDAQSLNDQQLKQAQRLRGTRLPNGQRYAGHLQLPGDLEEARLAGFDVTDAHAMAAFYQLVMIEYTNH